MKHLLYLLLAACAWGQTAKLATPCCGTRTPVIPDCSADTPLGMVCVWRGMPETVKNAQGVIVLKSGITGETEWPKGMHCAVGQWCVTPPKEPLDVPAIHIKGKLRAVPENCIVSSTPYFEWPSNLGPRPPDCQWINTSHWSCADPTRILEHDEQNPSRWWCRKVQP